jgi:ribonuclease D
MRVLDRLRRSSPRRVAIDVEGDSFYRYGERLCLVQIAFSGDTEICDPLSEDLAPLMADLEARELVFHGADFDIRLLHAKYGFRPRRVFDTMLAARFLGIPKFGLSDLYEREFGIVLEKKHQRADWCRRPLSGELLEYARKDVAHLEELGVRLSAELEAAGRAGWHREECDAVVERTIQNVRRPPDPEAWRVKGAGGLSRRELAFLRELSGARDAVARELDRALFRVFSAEDLLRLARLAAEDPESALRRFPRALPGRLLRGFSEAIFRGAALPPGDYPQLPGPRPRPRPGLEAVLRRLTERRDAAAAALGLEAGFLLARSAIVRVAEMRPRSLEELEAAMGSRWRARALADALLA